MTQILSLTGPCNNHYISRNETNRYKTKGYDGFVYDDFADDEVILAKISFARDRGATLPA